MINTVPLSIFNIDLSAGNLILFISLLMFVSILVTKIGSKFGVPTMLLFLVIGMLAGEDGLGIKIENLHVAEFLGHLAMTIILLSGGLETSLAETKPIIRKGISMTTLGMFITIAATGAFIYYSYGTRIGGAGATVMGSFLLAAVLSSTDSASVFSILRDKRLTLRQNLGPLLELESGSNDPMAYVLTILLVQIMENVESISGASSAWFIALNGVWLLVKQVALGFGMGLAIGHGARWLLTKVHLSNGSLYSIFILSIAMFANGAASSGEFSQILLAHADDVASKYMQYPELYPEPWDGAWEEYAAALRAVAAGGLAAGPDNAEFLDAVECFPLTSKSFYAMIEGESWCKLVVAGLTGLLEMDLHNLPQPVYGEAAAVVNSEICSLHLETRALLLEPDELGEFRALLARNGASFPEAPPAKDDRAPNDPSRIYFFYNASDWCEWSPQIAKANLPLSGTIKPEFDVKGCASVFRVIEDVPQLLSGSARRSYWNAAAKPFGTIEASSSRSIVTDHEAYGMVLPAFEAVRLVPLALADPGDLSTADSAWLRHVRDHVLPGQDGDPWRDGRISPPAL